MLLLQQERDDRVSVITMMTRIDLLGYFDEVSRKSGMISDYAKLTRCALVLSFNDDLEEPYHIHMLEPHMQVGGVLTENTLLTLEYMVVDDEPGDFVTADVLKRTAREWHGCGEMPASVKGFLNDDNSCWELLFRYGKLLYLDI
jgi:hypothetical protein